MFKNNNVNKKNIIHIAGPSYAGKSMLLRYVSSWCIKEQYQKYHLLRPDGKLDWVMYDRNKHRIYESLLDYLAKPMEWWFIESSGRNSMVNGVCPPTYYLEAPDVNALRRRVANPQLFNNIYNFNRKWEEHFSGKRKVSYDKLKEMLVFKCRGYRFG